MQSSTGSGSLDAFAAASATCGEPSGSPSLPADVHAGSELPNEEMASALQRVLDTGAKLGLALEFLERYRSRENTARDCSTVGEIAIRVGFGDDQKAALLPTVAIARGSSDAVGEEQLLRQLLDVSQALAAAAVAIGCCCTSSRARALCMQLGTRIVSVRARLQSELLWRPNALQQ